MAKVLCNMTDCKYCGRKSSTWHRADGSPLYNCKLEVIQVAKIFDLDGEIEQLSDEIAVCRNYEREDTGDVL